MNVLIGCEESGKVREDGKVTEIPDELREEITAANHEAASNPLLSKEELAWAISWAVVELEKAYPKPTENV